ncbi:MAG: hypothetical protein ACK4H7_03265 [Acidilobaceae archaeon]
MVEIVLVKTVRPESREKIKFEVSDKDLEELEQYLVKVLGLGC